ncbi:MAG: hypothetical protein J6S97_00420 [Bacteroidales bacterium]|nr:hypothetical protein [Bacteroidales bacterium]MBP5381726.1 hypothetical protein [Bacteroidales bacterium]MBP5522115.1 hypothetical protein [Bacteroidales bacterium]
MTHTTIICESYTAPTVRVLQIGPARCIAGSDKMSDMDTNPIFEEDFD